LAGFVTLKIGFEAMGRRVAVGFFLMGGLWWAWRREVMEVEVVVVGSSMNEGAGEREEDAEVAGNDEVGVAMNDELGVAMNDELGVAMKDG
jgi:hypothetical protein